MAASKPDCYTCVHRRSISGDAHSRCHAGWVSYADTTARVTGHPHGIARGWFRWPINFDPVWLESCDSWTDDAATSLPEAQRQSRHAYDPLAELLALLR